HPRHLDEAGVVDENVDAAERLERPVDELPHVRLTTDVGIDHDCATAVNLDLPPNLERSVRIRPVAVVTAEVADGDVGALGRERARDRAPDPAASAGHERGAALQRAGPARGCRRETRGHPSRLYGGGLFRISDP